MAVFWVNRCSKRGEKTKIIYYKYDCDILEKVKVGSKL